MNRYLVFSSIGNNSLHNIWLDTTNRNYDVVLAYYGDDETYFAELEKKNSTDFKTYRKKGLKWPNFSDYVKNNDVTGYKYIWIPDDDIKMSGDNINRMFQVLEEFPNIHIACPSTSIDSVDAANRKRIDNHNCKMRVQYRNLIECGMIVIKGTMLQNNFFIKIMNATNT